MSHPYDRAVALSLLRLVASHHTYAFKRVSHETVATAAAAAYSRGAVKAGGAKAGTLHTVSSTAEWFTESYSQ